MIHLFRPFLKVDLTTSKLVPREICANCAAEIAMLVLQYRQTYGLRRVPLVMTHCILSSSIIHLINLPKPSDAHDLAQGLGALNEMSVNHAFASRSLKIVLDLARQWNIHLPDEVVQYKLPPVKAPSSQEYPGFPSPGLSSHSQPQDTNLGKCIANELPFKNTPPGTFAQPAEMFWTPVKGQNVPLHAPEPAVTGPMDISAMVDWNLHRDGFQMANLGENFLGPPLYHHNRQSNVNRHTQLNGYINGQANSNIQSHWSPS